MFGDRIRDIRKLNQLNQIEFSQRIGVSQGTLSELEQNKYNPSLETIQAIIKVLDVNAAWLLFGDEATLSSHEGLGILSKLERSMVNNFRKLSPQEQMRIMNIIDLNVDSQR